MGLGSFLSLFLAILGLDALSPPIIEFHGGGNPSDGAMDSGSRSNLPSSGHFVEAIKTMKFDFADVNGIAISINAFNLFKR